MNNNKFIHLHLHTEYSLLDGACRVLDLNGKPADIFSLANKYGMDSIAITDHGNMYGVIEFYKTCLNAGIKPIIGCELYVAPGSRFDKKMPMSESSYHLTILCKNEQGYKNLIKLVSLGYLEGFYYKPRVDKEMLKKYSEGLIALSGCMKGEIPKAVLKKDENFLKKIVDEYIDIFGKDNLYLEIQDHSIPEQKLIRDRLVELSKEQGLPLVATNDTHYAAQKDAYMQEVLLCIGTGKTMDDVSRMKFSSDNFYFKSFEEMEEIFKDVPEALSNTVEIAKRCNVELDFSKVYLPDYNVPAGFALDTYLEHLCKEALSSRYKEITQEINDRLEHELNIINKMGYPGYFLIVWDFIKYARENDIPVGPGRGSGAGSIVSYLLHITDVDPLKYGLIFERFLNPDRLTMPDLDIDFSDEGREKIIQYVRDKYGENNVGQIVTFGSMQARLAIRDIGRALNIPLKDVDKMAKLIPFGSSAYGALSLSKELKKMVNDNQSFKDLFDLVRRIEGIKRHIGVHAAGIVIAKDEITNYVPFTKSSKNVPTTQYEGNSLVSLGLLKMDFLGLRNLTVIANTVKLVKKYRGIDIDIDNLPLDDDKTYKFLGDAKAIGVFQMESSGMRDLLRKIKPTCLEDIIALIALYRPGPMGSGMLDDFVKRKHGKSKIKYDHPLLEPILKETYGVILYQEQVMQMAVTLSGFTPAQSDSLRKAMGKKIPEIIEKERAHFVKGAKVNNIQEKLSTKIFDNIVKFGGYGFNKSHSTAYGILSYRTAYLKANYPVEYMTALLNSELGNTDKIALYVSECKDMGIEILPPDVQKSFEIFSVEGNVDDKKVRFGFLAIKNVGAGVSSIVEARQDSEFKSLTDLLRRIDLRSVNKKVVESLVKAGAFDSLNYKRAPLFEGIERLMTIVSKSCRDNIPGQGSLFSGMEESLETKEELPDIHEWQEHHVLSYEKEVLGFYMSGHPLAHIAKDLKALVQTSVLSVKNFKDDQEVTIGGIITHSKHLRTKKGADMAVFKIEDTDDEIEAIVFPKTYKDLVPEVISVDNIVIVKGKCDTSRDECKILVDSVIPFDEAKARLVRKMVITMKTAGLEKETLESAKDIISAYPGRCEVMFQMVTPVHGNVSVSSKEYITPDKELESKIKKLFGEDSIRYLI